MPCHWCTMLSTVHIAKQDMLDVQPHKKKPLLQYFNAQQLYSDIGMVDGERTRLLFRAKVPDMRLIRYRLNFLRKYAVAVAYCT